MVEAFEQEPVAKRVHLARVLTVLSLGGLLGGYFYIGAPASGAPQPTIGVPAPVDKASPQPGPPALTVSSTRPTVAHPSQAALTPLLKTSGAKASGAAPGKASRGASTSRAAKPLVSGAAKAKSSAQAATPVTANEAEASPEAPTVVAAMASRQGVIMPKTYSIPTVATSGTTLTEALLAKGRVSWPVKGYGLGRQSYGPRVHPVRHTPDFHTGQDISVPCGTPVYAAGDGKIMYAAWGGGYGNRVVLQENSHITTTYSHLSAFLVKPGEKVKLGQPVGLAGTTGNSTGCHLHFEVIQDGYFTNPWTWLTGQVPLVTTKGYANNGYYYFNRVTQGPSGPGTSTPKAKAAASGRPKPATSASAAPTATPPPKAAVTSSPSMTPKATVAPTPSKSGGPVPSKRPSAPGTKAPSGGPTASSASSASSAPTASATASSSATAKATALEGTNSPAATTSPTVVPSSTGAPAPGSPTAAGSRSK